MVAVPVAAPTPGVIAVPVAVTVALPVAAPTAAAVAVPVPEAAPVPVAVPDKPEGPGSAQARQQLVGQDP